MFPGWQRQLTTLEYVGVSIFRETLASKACLLFKCAFALKAKRREKWKKSVQDCCPIVFCSEWPQIPTPLLMWLESHGCCHSPLVFPTHPFCLPS